MKTSKSLSFVIIVFSFIVFPSFTYASIIMQPYLQAVTKNSIYILVECDSRDTVTVDYGISKEYGDHASTELAWPTNASPNTYVHKIRLAGLKENTIYHYKASQNNSVSENYTFKTAVSPGIKFRFGWMADCRQGTNIHDTISTRIYEAKPDFLLYGGDICSKKTYGNLKEEFFREKELEVISNIPFFYTPGNHEGWGTNIKAFVQNPLSPSNTQDYYSFDYGDAHILVINTELHRTIDSKQFEFAQKDLSSTNKKWKIVISHKPAYSGEVHEDNDMKLITTQIFEPNKVSMVISAHAHFYQHNLINGIHHMVIGTAGAPLYWPVNKPYTKKTLRDYTYAIADVSPDSFVMAIYDSNGTKIDEIRL
jgi:hypothetical protein